MKKFTILDKEGLVTLFAGVVGLLLLLSITGCSTAPVAGCEDKMGAEKDECIRLKQAHEHMVRSGFYDGGNANK